MPVAKEHAGARLHLQRQHRLKLRLREGAELLVFNGDKVTRTDEAVKQLIADKLEKWPHANQVVVFWESYTPMGPYAQAPELIGQKPAPYDAARQKIADARWAFVEQVARVVRKDFPQLKVRLGNSLTCNELIAEVLRRKPPKDWFTHIGTEAIQRTAHPEKPNIPFTMMWSRQLMDTARALGYDYKVTCCPENISRKPDTIGQDVSMGCVRLAPDNIAFVYQLIEPGRSYITINE